MFSFILRRLAILIPTFFGITILTFLLIHMIPGDPVMTMLGERNVDPEMYKSIMARLGLDQPLHIQYLNYLGGLLQGDFGKSFSSQSSVWGEFAALFPATLELGICACCSARSSVFCWACWLPSSAAHSWITASWVCRSLVTPCRFSGGA